MALILTNTRFPQLFRSHHGILLNYKSTRKGTIRGVSYSSVAALLKEKSLFKQQAYVNGKWIDGDDTFEVYDPGNGKLIAQVPNMKEKETHDAIKHAKQGFETWRKMTAKERSKIIRKIADYHVEFQEDLAKILTLECGKPLAEAKSEILYGASFFEWFGEEAKRLYGETIPDSVSNRRTLVFKQPVGVCALITPWNFPNAMISRKSAAALAAGCSVVIKPANDTPLSALALAALVERAGVPPGVFNVVTACKQNSKLVGNELLKNADVRKISFTGSTAVGKYLMQHAADTMKRVSMELGGNAPLIVFEDADVDVAVDAAIQSKFRNSGQTCVCANRIYVQKDIYKQFCIRFIEKVRNFKVGHGLDPEVNFGPLINAQARDKTKEFVNDASKAGAVVAMGGHQLDNLQGYFFEPTVLTEVDDAMRVNREETFGPIAPILSFESEDEVVRRANATTAGLASYFFTSDLSRMFRVSEALEYGMVGVNTGIISSEVAPFGGIKESGLGREGSKHGLDDYTELKYVAVAGKM